MKKQTVIFRDLGLMDYKSAWDYQEQLLHENVKRKSLVYSQEPGIYIQNSGVNSQETTQLSADPAHRTPGSAFRTPEVALPTTHYLLFVEHPPVYTLGKSGKMEHVLLNEEQLQASGIEFFRTNRGGDITFHGQGQIVGYPILDLEKFFTDIGKYMRSLEEVIILTLAGYGIRGDRSPGETGVWIDPHIKGRERKICAIGVRSSRWVTMHGFALNVNTDLSYFNHIIPCGISNKQVTSMQKETGHEMNMEEVKGILKKNFEKVFQAELLDG
jgi:lipoyl(octanoyl) transferase